MPKWSAFIWTKTDGMVRGSLGRGKGEHGGLTPRHSPGRLQVSAAIEQLGVCLHRRGPDGFGLMRCRVREGGALVGERLGEGTNRTDGRWSGLAGPAAGG